MKYATNIIFFIFFSFFLFFLLPSVFAAECGATPTNHCTISRNTVFNQGKYAVHNITFVRDNVALDCNSATLQGSATSTASLMYVGGRSGLTIKNCKLENYSFGISNEGVMTSSGTLQPIGYFLIQNNTFTSKVLGTAIRLSEQLAINLTRSPSVRHQILNNTITDDHIIGIIVENANATLISGNTLTMGSQTNANPGIYVVGGNLGKYEYNTLDGAKMIITRYNLDDGSRNVVQANTIQNADTALEIWEGMDATLAMDNNLTEDALGMWIRADNTLILSNTFTSSGTDSSAGVIIEQTTQPQNNTVLLNNFNSITNPVSDISGFKNFWNAQYTLKTTGLKQQLGNYYSQFSKSTQCRSYQGGQMRCCTDVNADNICDEPFEFQGNNDSYPLRSPVMESNFPPFFEPVPDMFLNESEAVLVTLNATSFNETIFYSINDTRFIPAPSGLSNQFLWQTNFADAGFYTFTAYALDGLNLQSKIEFNITLFDADDNCSAHPTRIANSCIVKNSVTFPAGSYFVPDGIRVGADQLTINCNGATMYGFSGRPGTGITFENRQNVLLQDCIIQNYITGVNVTNSQQVTLTNVDALNNNQQNSGSYGVVLVSSSNNRIEDSNISGNGDTGIHLYASHNNTITGNTIDANENVAGIALFTSSGNTIAFNNINDNENGGILFGILFNSGPSDLNVVTDNTIERTKQNYGFHLRRGNNNVFYHNNLINNNARSKQVDGGSGNIGNQWSLNNEGNYYSDHACIGNRLCSNAYTFFGGTDFSPFREQNDWLYPEPYLIAPQTIQQGQTVTITVVGTPKHAGELYVIALALGNSTGIPILENKKIYLDGDIILQLSLQIPQAFGLTNTVGNLDQNGNAQIMWTPPLNLPLQNLTFYIGGVTIDFARPVFPVDGIFVPSPVTIT